MNQIIIIGVILILLLITFLFSRKEQISKAESDIESMKTKKESWSQEKVMKYDEIQSRREALLKAVDEKFKDNPEQSEDLKKMINDWAELRTKIFTDRRSWVRNPEKDKK
jgi:Flp pilus assembly protein TadB|tara:strand:+ start:287 stop:616 length:330 start_codon:yes stop_codon:yes gene_type:complete